MLNLKETERKHQLGGNMERIYDIYDGTTFKLVKADVKLGKRSNSHKDLTEGRYIKERIGSDAPEIDHDTMVESMHLLQKQINALQTWIMDINSRLEAVGSAFLPKYHIPDEMIEEMEQFRIEMPCMDVHGQKIDESSKKDDDLPF